MARTTQDALILSPTARAKLKVRNEPYYRAVHRGLALGYRRGQRGGTWLARIRLPEEASYVELKLGGSDDSIAANGVTILDYDGAVVAARSAFCEREARRSSGVLTAANKATLDDVFNLYRAAYLAGDTGKRRGPGRDITNVDSMLKCHLRPRLGAVRVDQIHASIFETFKEAIVVAPRLSRSGKPIEVDPAATDFDESEAVRKRKARANRVITLLRAALNLALKKRWFASDAAWDQALLPYPHVDVASVRYLEIAECDALKAAVEEDFRIIVRGALLTGCRYGSLRFLKCGDVDLKAGTALIRVSKSGEMQHVQLNQPGVNFLSSATAGRPRDAFVFTKADGSQWKPSDQARRMERGCVQAGIDPVTFHELRDTFASHLVMAGVPLLTVSKLLGHKDIRTTEKYYAHLAPSHLKAAVEAHLPAF